MSFIKKALACRFLMIILLIMLTSLKTVFANDKKDDIAKALKLNREATELARQGRYNEAIPKAKRALELTRKIYGAKHPDVAADLFSLANIYMGKGDFFNAEPLILEAIKIDKELYGPNHPEVAIDLGGLALLYTSKKDYKAAEKTYLSSLTILSESIKNPKSQYLEYYAGSSLNLANVYVAMKEYDKAFLYYLNSEQIYEVIDKQAAIKVLTKMAELKRELGDHSAAKAFLERAQLLSRK